MDRTDREYECGESGTEVDALWKHHNRLFNLTTMSQLHRAHTASNGRIIKNEMGMMWKEATVGMLQHQED
jgi:hypothetical protein